MTVATKVRDLFSRNHLLDAPTASADTGEAILRKGDERLIIEPFRKGRPLALLASLESLESLEETFPDVDKYPTPLDEVEL